MERHWFRRSSRPAAALLALAVLLLGFLLPLQPAEAQDLFCEYDPSILVQTDQGPVLVHLFFRTSRVVDSKVIEALADESPVVRSLSARLVRQRGVVVAPKDAMLEYLEAHTYFRVASVERKGSAYTIRIESYVSGPLKLRLTAYVAFDRDDPTSTAGLTPIVAPSPFLQQNPWIQPAPGFRADVFSNFDTATSPNLMRNAITLSAADIRQQLSRTKLAMS
jgi:hypothetical protein